MARTAACAKIFGWQRLSTLDLLDGSFVLLTGSDGGPWSQAAAQVATALQVKLAPYRIGPAGDLLNPDHNWAQKMGVSPDGAVLVRPDGFVAWRARNLAATPELVLEQVLNRILCRSITTANA